MKRNGDPLTDIGGRHEMPAAPQKCYPAVKKLICLAMAGLAGAGSMFFYKDSQVKQIQSKNDLLESYVRTAAKEIDLSPVRSYYGQVIKDALVTAGAQMSVDQVVQLGISAANKSKKADMYQSYQKHVVMQDLMCLAAHFQGQRDDFKILMDSYASYNGEYLGEKENINQGAHKLNQLFMWAGRRGLQDKSHQMGQRTVSVPSSDLAMIQKPAVSPALPASNKAARHASRQKPAGRVAQGSNSRQRK